MSEQPRILIVDDHPINVLILGDLLEDDYQVATASSGEEALARMSEFAPDLILLDVMMPGIDGYELCRRIRRTPTSSHAKVIMVSAKAMPAEREHGLKAGADDYITKPFESADLLDRVRLLLG